MSFPFDGQAIAAITGALAVLTSAAAAGAAWRSAGAARDAAKHARGVEQRALMREVLGAAQAVVAESLRVDDIANTLKRSYRDFANFLGQPDSSREKLHIGEVEKKQHEVGILQDEARRFV